MIILLGTITSERWINVLEKTKITYNYITNGENFQDTTTCELVKIQRQLGVDFERISKSFTLERDGVCWTFDDSKALQAEIEDLITDKKVRAHVFLFIVQAMMGRITSILESEYNIVCTSQSRKPREIQLVISGTGKSLNVSVHYNMQLSDHINYTKFQDPIYKDVFIQFGCDITGKTIKYFRFM